MLGLVAALGLGILIASPQVLATLRYYPTTIRTNSTYADKVRFGNLSLSRLIQNLLSPRLTAMVDGLHYPEGICYIGLLPLSLIWFSHETFWWIILLLSIGLVMGKRSVLFRWTHWVHLRIPARYCYFVSLSLIMLALDGFRLLSFPLMRLVVLGQAWDLLMNTSRLIPMEPYVQRWERPETVFTRPLATFLAGKSGRVSGLPYPFRTGHVHHLQTIGYNGGAQPQWMARLRQDANPDGSGASNWFALNEDGRLLDWYGVKWAYTYRSLRGKWCQTLIPHLYENSQAKSPPTWKEVAARYGTHKSRRRW